MRTWLVTGGAGFIGGNFVLDAVARGIRIVAEPVVEVVGEGVVKSERCCGESGTLGVTRPDISTQVRFRKTEELRKSATALQASGKLAGAEKLLRREIDASAHTCSPFGTCSPGPAGSFDNTGTTSAFTSDTTGAERRSGSCRAGRDPNARRDLGMPTKKWKEC